MNTTSITRRNFIKRTATTAVAAAFAVGAFQSYAFTEANGSCFCWEIWVIENNDVNPPRHDEVSVTNGIPDFSKCGGTPRKVLCTEAHPDGDGVNLSGGNDEWNITPKPGGGLTYKPKSGHSKFSMC